MNGPAFLPLVGTALLTASIPADAAELFIDEATGAVGLPGVCSVQGISLSPGVVCETGTGKPERIQLPDGTPAVRVAYEVSEPVAKDGAAPVPAPSVTGLFVARPCGMEVTFDVTGLPADPKLDLGLSMLKRVLEGSHAVRENRKLGRWRRHDGGGIPFEESAGQMLAYEGADGRPVSLAMQPPSIPEWCNPQAQHSPLECVGPGHFRSHVVVVPDGPDTPNAAAALALVDGRKLSVSVSTGRPYHWWTSAPGRPTEVSFRAEFSNQARERTLRTAAWVRDFDGRTVLEDAGGIVLPAGGGTSRTYAFTVSEPRGLYFAEVSLKDPATGEEAFVRINLAVLPPHEFRSTPEQSIFGLSAYWPATTEEDVQILMDRMGVRWIRLGDTRVQHPPRIANHLSDPLGEKVPDDKRDEWILAQLRHCLENGNAMWELGNEANMSTLGIAMEGGGIGKAMEAPRYSEWVKAVRRVQKEHPETARVKVLGLGLAGMDVPFTEKMKECGSLDLLDGFCLHPGRGNFAPDYPVEHPWEALFPGNHTDHSSHGSYWNYFGSVRTARNTLRRLGQEKMPLFLTEIYTPTFPNSYWEDTPRGAAENVVLEYALALAEGVTAAYYYQLFDSVWYNRFGVNPRDREYHFGLIHRNHGFKPCMMAYIAASEALERAEFKGWAKFDDPDLRGMLFATPEGPLTILWSRADGYVLTDPRDFVSPEPWVDTWKTKTEVALPAEGASVTVLDCIGRSRKVKAEGGSAKLTVDGSPLLVYGLRPTPWKASDFAR